ncbi:MAG: transcriptional regulator [Chloroflexota bacterium]
MSKVLSLRLKDQQVDRLSRSARRMGRTLSETAAVFLEESLRQSEFALIEFHDSPAGRQAYLKGSRLAIWQIVDFSIVLQRDIEGTADRLEIAPAAVRAALTYAATYPEEINYAIQDNAKSEADLRQLIPNLETAIVDPTAS